MDRTPLFRSRRRVSSDTVMPNILFALAAISILTTAGIVFVLLEESLRFFRKVPFLEFITGTKWTPLFSDPQYGVLPLVTGTLVVTAIAGAVALPLGLGSAIYLSEYAPRRVRAVLKPLLEILAGIPTIVYGFFALTFVTPLIQAVLPQTKVFNALSAGIVVGIMIVPMISSLSEDAMSAVPDRLRSAAYALGATKLEVALQVVVPAAFSGIAASFVLGISRAVGETMIVTLAAGALPTMSINPLGSVQTLTAYIVSVASGDTTIGSAAYLTMYSVGFVLFAMTLAMNLVARYISRKFREEY
mgnify:CR=1 FL=1